MDYRRTHIPEHPNYRAMSDGVVMGPDPMRPEERDSKMPMFWCVERSMMMVVLYVTHEGRRNVPLPFPLAQMIARGFGADEGYMPGFYDGDPTNCRPSNLIMSTALSAPDREPDDTLHQCPACAKAYRREGHLQRHIESKHPELVGKNLEVGHGV